MAKPEVTDKVNVEGMEQTGSQILESNCPKRVSTKAIVISLAEIRAKAAKKAKPPPPPKIVKVKEKPPTSKTKPEPRTEFKCDDCDKVFKLNYKLQDHIRGAHKREYECRPCGLQFNEKNNMRQHNKRVHQGNTYTCHICGKSLKTSGGIRKYHMLHIHGINEYSPAKYSCNQCDKKYVVKEAFDKHVKEVHEENKPPRKMEFKCLDCGAKFKSRRERQKHADYFRGSPHEDIKCNLCDERFFTVQAVKSHMHTEHKEEVEDESEFPCWYCDNVFQTGSKLKQHVEWVHAQVKKHVCPTCGHVFLKKHLLDVHVTTVHERLKPHKCNICDKTFGEKSSLRKHVAMVHQRLRKHICHVCDKGITSKKMLQYHLAAKHGIGERPVLLKQT